MKEGLVSSIVRISSMTVRRETFPVRRSSTIAGSRSVSRLMLAPEPVFQLVTIFIWLMFTST